MTRELDEQVALAMGWKRPSMQGRCGVCGWPIAANMLGCLPTMCSMRPLPKVRADDPPAYSTDWARLPEMIRWLLEHVEVPHEHELKIVRDGDLDTCDAYLSDCSGYEVRAAGDNELLAVCNLIVAVAKEKP